MNQIRQKIHDQVRPQNSQKRFSVSFAAFLIMAISIALAVATKWEWGLAFLVAMTLASIPIGKYFNF